MAKRPPLTDTEVTELFAKLDDSGVLDPSWKEPRRQGRLRRALDRILHRGKADAGEDVARAAAVASPYHHGTAKVDPLSDADPSGSKVGETISRTAILCIVVVLVAVLGMQMVYSVSRRLNTANLSERADMDTVTHALQSGVEWGDGFTQFPSEFTVEQADEESGVIEVSVVDTTSGNELELLSNSQIQASALSTNALVNDKINRVIYNVYARVDENGNFEHDALFGFLKSQGTPRAMLTFIWSKESSAASGDIDWTLRIVGMDDDLTGKIQEQVNSVSSLTESPSASDVELEDMRAWEQDELASHGSALFEGSTDPVPAPEEDQADGGASGDAASAQDNAASADGAASTDAAATTR